MSTMNLTLLTDLYQLTMMQGYFKNKNNDTVVFDAFYRTNPSGNGFAIAAGLEQVIDYLKNLRFSPEDIEYLRGLHIFDEDFLDYLVDFKFTGSVYAIPEGTVVFPKEPLLKVIAPIMEAQLIETAILNIVNHQSLIATKAARVVYAAKGDGVMEFGLRRAQGPDAGVYGARAAMIGGCVGTSNVLAGQMFDVPVLGTHAHSWIMSFPDEYTAFKKYAELYPNACTLLVDTYDTLKSGVPNAIRVFKEMREAGIPLTKYGIRLDSGDLAYLSKRARKMLDKAGFPDAVISASSDLDENLIDSLKAQGAEIRSWGVGTNLITSKDQPAFGDVYKLAAIKNADGTYTPKIKLSENTAKVTNPGNKTVYRIYDKETGMLN
ncbi:MAG: nicotinate phosphoribosyltransferase, partial [Lachnospiraceae bacterium]|nr:nicotinate phosphoribosyltransferase [Lachnospiraceae bacterium]